MRRDKLKIRIGQIYDEIEYQEPDISTERLLQKVCDQINLETEHEFDFDVGDIASAL